MQQQRSGKVFICILAIILTAVVWSVCISIQQLGVANPVSAGIGLAKVMLTDSPYEQIQQEPAVYVARSDGAEKNLIQCMRKNGYSCVPELAEGEDWVFAKGNLLATVHFQVKEGYSQWVVL